MSTEPLLVNTKKSGSPESWRKWECANVPQLEEDGEKILEIIDQMSSFGAGGGTQVLTCVKGYCTLSYNPSSLHPSVLCNQMGSEPL